MWIRCFKGMAAECALSGPTGVRIVPHMGGISPPGLLEKNGIEIVAGREPTILSEAGDEEADGSVKKPLDERLEVQTWTA